MRVAGLCESAEPSDPFHCSIHLTKTGDMESLKEMNTFGIAANAEAIWRCRSELSLRKASARLAREQQPYYILGGGANVLFARDFPGVIIHPTGRKREILEGDQTSILVRAEAGLEWDRLVAWAVARNLWGVECLSGIPGSVGAAPVQNIGAYGAEVGDVLEWVEAVDLTTGASVQLKREELRLGYRDSIFKHELRGTHVIYAIVVRLYREPLRPIPLSRLHVAPGEPYKENPKWVRKKVLSVRGAKLPDVREVGSAGSFFKNAELPLEQIEALRARYPDIPVYPSRPGMAKIASGWLIEQCGWKGYREGPVGVYPKQALVLVNYGGATGAQVLALRDKIVRDVAEKRGVHLEPEVNIVA